MRQEGPISANETKALFADLASVPALLLAISGGPDSTALLLLAARWRAALKSGPRLLAVTVDHGLRPESAREAADVARLARRLKVPHRILRWTGRKPKTGLQAAGREARYRLLARVAAETGARHVVTAHTRDDQAETVLIRLARGSGLAGLAAMARISPLPAFIPAPSPLEGEGRGGGYSKEGGEEKNAARNSSDRLLLVRPLLDIPKSRLIATLRAARIPFADDPSNRDPRFTRARIRDLMPALAQEGLSSARLAVLARRLARANAAVERAAAAAFSGLQTVLAPGPLEFDAAGLRRLPDEIALRVLGRAIAKQGDEGPVELSKLETLYEELVTHQAAGSGRWRRTLAGALVTLQGDRLLVDRAPPRRAQARTVPLTKHKDDKRKLGRRR